MLHPAPDDAADLRLVRAAAEGEDRALAEILRRLACVPLILSARNRRMGNPLDAALLQDLGQECLVAIWTGLGRFDGRSSFEAWVYRFCLHKHLAAVRDRGRRLGIERVESPLLGGAAVAGHESTIDEEQLLLALEELDPLRARIVRLKNFEDLTFEEIGKRLALSPNTAKTHYYRALKALRESLQRRGVLPG